MTQFDDHMTDKHQTMDHAIPEKLKRRVVTRTTSAMVVDFREFAMVVDLINTTTACNRTSDVGASIINVDETGHALFLSHPLLLSHRLEQRGTYHQT